MDVNHLIGDAFQADQNSNNSQSGAHGQRLTDAASYLANFDSGMSPKCNSVSFFKPESRPRECRNGVAVSDRYICYIVKGTMLRVIDTVSADKTLLKGHKSFITDLFFSGVSSESLCSVDMSRDGDGVFFWRLSSSEGALSSQITGRFAVSACLVRPHPVLAGLWVISDGTQLGILSEHHPSDTVKGYGDFNMHKLFPEGVRGAEFCSDGLQLIVTAGEGAHSSMYIFKLPSQNELSRLHESRFELTLVFHIPMGNLQSASFLHSTGISQELVITAQSVPEHTEQLLVSVWSQESFHDKPLTLVQSVNVAFPLIASMGDGGEGFHSDMIVDPSRNKGFVLVSHRCSSFVCVLSVRQDGARLALYHASYLDLGKPILCMIPAVVQGEDHETSPSSPFGSGGKRMIQHLELTCMQDTMNAQHAIQQFHMSLESVVPVPPVEEAVPPPAALGSPTGLTRMESTNPFDALTEGAQGPPAAASPKPAADVSLLMNLLKGTSPAPAAEAHPLQSPAADNFPYFALQKQEPVDKPASPVAAIAPVAPVAPVASIASDYGSGFSAPAAQPSAAPLPVSSESRQQGLRIIDFLKSSAPSPAPAPSSEPTAQRGGSSPPADVNPFDEAPPAAATSSGGKKKDKKKAGAPSTTPAVTTTATAAAAAAVAVDGDLPLSQGLLGQLQAVVSEECRSAVEDVLKRDGWKDEMCVQISNDLKAELTMAVTEAVREGIKDQLRESVKNYLGKSFKTAFETTLVPAFQVGTAVLHAKLQENFDQASKAADGLSARDSEAAAKLDSVQAELAALRSAVSSLTAEVSALRAGRGLAAAAAAGPAVEYEEDPLVLLSQGRVAEAVECALEKRSVPVLLEVLKGTSADAVLGGCSKLVVVCVIQQLAQDFSLNDPEEGVPARLDWLKELVMAVVSGDVERKMSLDGEATADVTAVESACVTLLHGVFECLKKAEARIAPTGSVRTDLRMLCSLVKSVE